MRARRATRGNRGTAVALLLLVLTGAAITAGTDLAVTEPTFTVTSDVGAVDPAADPTPPTDSVDAQTADADAPGKLLSWESVQWGGLDRVQRIVYRTRGPDGLPTTASALVRLPAGAAEVASLPIVAWTHGTSGMGQDCGLLGIAGLANGNAPIVARFSDAGYAVVIPDYLGLSPDSPGPHPYLHRQTEATATIDAVRAARARFDVLSTTWLVAGHSQGGHAALSTGNLAPTYAPELDLRGIVALAPTSNVESVYALAAPQMPSLPFFPRRNFAAVLNSVRTTHPQLDVNSYLSPVGRDLVDRVATACYGQWPDIIGNRSPGELLSRPLGTPEFETALREHLAVPTADYRDPILIVHGSGDRTVPLWLTEKLIGEFAAAGTPYELRVLDAQHGDLAVRGGIDLALDFAGRVLPPV